MGPITVSRLLTIVGMDERSGVLDVSLEAYRMGARSRGGQWLATWEKNGSMELFGLVIVLIIEDVEKGRQEAPEKMHDNLTSKGCLKMLRCKASEISRNEAYIEVRLSDERRG
jgi:hypothetical protein